MQKSHATKEEDSKYAKVFSLIEIAIFSNADTTITSAFSGKLHFSNV